MKYSNSLLLCVKFGGYFLLLNLLDHSDRFYTNYYCNVAILKGFK